ncbi:cytochrome b5 domain-containing protein [Haloimpatiens sp. FM7315]|uniref:cytochrome b5 domain-containing protein n=1 Tax=Haloimpatiens sp. FM7315 TaxID=3298609 RepID=UPI0039776870
MNSKECRDLIRRMELNIYNLQAISYTSINIYEKMFYEKLILRESCKIKTLKDFLFNMKIAEKISIDYKKREEATFTLEELKKYDGKKGNNAYVAIDGVVYDVTYNAVWAGGTHFGLNAGQDLSEEIKSCHNKENILKTLKKVGVLI